MYWVYHYIRAVSGRPRDEAGFSSREEITSCQHILSGCLGMCFGPQALSFVEGSHLFIMRQAHSLRSPFNM